MSLYRGDFERNMRRGGGRRGVFCYICVGVGLQAGTSWRPARGGYCRDGRVPASSRRADFFEIWGFGEWGREGVTIAFVGLLDLREIVGGLMGLSIILKTVHLELALTCSEVDDCGGKIERVEMFEQVIAFLLEI